MTEEDAKTKWCPFARTAFQFRAGDGNAMIVANRNEDDTPLSLCIGSACMAWRTHEITEHAEGSKFTTTHAFCGLAGKP